MPSFKAMSLDERPGERREAAIELLMAIITRCFESALSLVRATLPVFRALAKLQSYVGKKEGTEEERNRRVSAV